MLFYPKSRLLESDFISKQGPRYLCMYNLSDFISKQDPRYLCLYSLQTSAQHGRWCNLPERPPAPADTRSSAEPCLVYQVGEKLYTGKRVLWVRAWLSVCQIGELNKAWRAKTTGQWTQHMGHTTPCRWSSRSRYLTLGLWIGSWNLAVAGLQLLWCCLLF